MNQLFISLGRTRFESHAVIAQHFKRANFNAKITFSTVGLDYAEANFREFQSVERTDAHTGSAQIAFIVVDLNHIEISSGFKLHFFQSALDIIDQILRIFTTDGQTDQSVRKI